MWTRGAGSPPALGVAASLAAVAALAWECCWGPSLHAAHVDNCSRNNMLNQMCKFGMRTDPQSARRSAASAAVRRHNLLPLIAAAATATAKQGLQVGQ